MEYSNSVVDIYNNINNYTPNRNRKILIAFDGILLTWTQIKKFQSIIKELLIKCRKLNISLVFVTQSYLPALKDSRLNSKHYLTMKTQNKRELHHSANIDYKDFIKIHRKRTSKACSFLTIDTKLPADDPCCVRENLLDAL